MRARSISVLVLLGVFAVSAAGCQQAIKAITPTAIIKHVTIGAKVGSPDASLQGTLAKGYPTTLPLWDGAGVIHTRMIKTKNGKSWSATLQTNDPYDDVVKGMATGFQKQGWTVLSEDSPASESSTTVFTVTGSNSAGVVTITFPKKLKATRIDYVIELSGN